MAAAGGAVPLAAARTLQAPGYEARDAGPGLRCYRQRSAAEARTLAAEVAAGLGRVPRSLHPRLFYDARGSELFAEICRLPEYHITRTEAAMLRGMAAGAPEVARHARLVELGSGSPDKASLLLGAMRGGRGASEYVPIDVSGSVVGACARLPADFPGLRVTAIVDTYERGLGLAGRLGGGPSLIAFLGSSLGNMGPDEAAAFLRGVRGRMGAGDSLLLGLDTCADRAALEAAYDDPAGATARFNLNVLARINRELGADFDLGSFEHVAEFDGGAMRVDMYLRSSRRQSVSVPGCGLALELGEGELIHTESSHKYAEAGIRSMAGAAGLAVDRLRRDPAGLYALATCSAA